MDIERIRDIMVFTCNSLVFALGNVTWSVCDTTTLIKKISKYDRDIQEIKPLMGYSITYYPDNKNEPYDILLVPVAKNGRPCIIVVLPDQRMNYFFFHEDSGRMHTELEQLSKYVRSYIGERTHQTLKLRKKEAQHG